MVTILDSLSARKTSVKTSVAQKRLAGSYSRARHPEKEHRTANPIMRKPDWLKVKTPFHKEYLNTMKIVREHGLYTVCEEASCPNIGDCWSKHHATFLIMGDICTRACGFCNIRTGIPLPLDPEEPLRTAKATAKLGLRHVVVTSVDRDDLSDGGSDHIAQTIYAIRAHCPTTTIEVLTPDFFRKDNAAAAIIIARPDVFNHNLETTPSLYLKIRPGARYYHSLRLLEQVKNTDDRIFTKSGIMAGLGEKREEILQVMDDLRCAGVDFLTIGQYLPPSKRHAPLERYVTPEEFTEYQEIAYSKGFLMVSASPFTRSSYHADEDFAALVSKKKQKQAASL